LLLHGHPQTHAMWGKIAPRLARDFTVVAPDLRGYGRSSKPPTTPDHEPYSKRAMARDQIALMRRLGFERFNVCGHDRGGRVGYRLALDHPAAVTRLAVLDIIPTGDVWRMADMKFALGYWHWAFLAQPYPFPETFVAADPAGFYFRHDRAIHEPEAMADYLTCVGDPATIHAMCECYRAGASYDYAADEADRGKRRIACPVLVLWGDRGAVGKWYDVPAIWRGWADDMQGRGIDSGHFLPEEAPDATYAALRAFFA
jgi:haloacetate dehalogenase